MRLIDANAAYDILTAYYHQRTEIQRKALREALDRVPTAEPCNDAISRQAAIDALEREKSLVERPITETRWFDFGLRKAQDVLSELPSAQPEIVRCWECGFWDRDTLMHQFNDFRDWNEAECKILAERDPYHEINRYTEADDFCSYAERREE